MSVCPCRNKGHSCVFSEDVPHDIHVALSSSGSVMSRWRMVAQEVLSSEPTPALLKEDYY